MHAKLLADSDRAKNVAARETAEVHHEAGDKLDGIMLSNRLFCLPHASANLMRSAGFRCAVSDSLGTLGGGGRIQGALTGKSAANQK